MIDQLSIVEMPNEWLHNPPNFLDFQPDLQDLRQQIIDYSTSVLRKARLAFMERRDPTSSAKSIVIDVPQSKSLSRRAKTDLPFRNPYPENRLRLLTNYQLQKILGRLRIAEKAKKRLIWSPHIDADTALLCALATPLAERTNVAAFFDRHVRKEKYFFDEATAALNLWETEFHLSCPQLLDSLEGTAADDYNGVSRFLGGEKYIRRGATGFRFFGDFFDRFWTCHILEHEPRDGLNHTWTDFPAKRGEFTDGVLNLTYELIEARLSSLLDGRLPPAELSKRPWRQRKVLELLVFDHMLDQITVRYGEMFTEIDSHLQLQLSNRPKSQNRQLALSQTSAESSTLDILSISNAFFSSEMDSSAYLKIEKLWPPFQYTLQVMEEDLTESLDRISQWQARETDRMPERPRWTRNDETKYRSIITKLTASNNRKIHDLDRYRSKIKSFRESLASRLSSTRDDLTFKNAENVRYFTYVTVIFLPLGFGAAIMSTRGVPDARMVLALFIAVVIIFLPTILLLSVGPKLWVSTLRPLIKPEGRNQSKVTLPPPAPKETSQQPGGQPVQRMYTSSINPIYSTAYRQAEAEAEALRSQRSRSPTPGVSHDSAALPQRRDSQSTPTAKTPHRRTLKRIFRRHKTKTGRGADVQDTEKGTGSHL